MDSTPLHILSRILQTPTSVTTADVEALRTKYPYFALPAAMLFKHAPSAYLSVEQKRELLNFVATNSPDIVHMQEYIDLDRNDWANIYPPQTDANEQMSTDNAISTFLDTFGSTSPAEEALLEKLIFNPTPDYSQILEQEYGEDTTPEPAQPSNNPDLADEDSQMARIDAFIAQEKEHEHSIHEPMPMPPAATADHTPVEAPIPELSAAADDSTLSESLAKIFIKQGRYERALEIITTLNLKYPKKSAYFADQLRFLQKLVKIQQIRQEKSRQTAL